MFTGIIEEVGNVTLVQPGRLVITAGDILQGMELGASMSVNGVCLTITGMTATSFSVDIMPETLQRSNLQLLAVGDRVNLERPLALNGRLGGHLVQGHIDATGKLTSIRWDGAAKIMGFEAPPEVMKYVVEKGFIAVDGISLTVAARNSGSFSVSIVDYTRQHTNLGDRKVGDPVNLEVDVIAKYVEQLGQPRSVGITIDFLQENGFLVS